MDTQKYMLYTGRPTLLLAGFRGLVNFQWSPGLNQLVSQISKWQMSHQSNQHVWLVCVLTNLVESKCRRRETFSLARQMHVCALHAVGWLQAFQQRRRNCDRNITDLKHSQNLASWDSNNGNSLNSVHRYVRLMSRPPSKHVWVKRFSVDNELSDYTWSKCC